jgi:hypothetical protein
MPLIEPLHSPDPAKPDSRATASCGVAAASAPASEPPAPAPKPRSAPRAGKPKTDSFGSVSSIFVTVTVAASVVAASWGGYKALEFARQYVAQQDRFHVPLRNVEVTPPPEWIKADLWSEVQQLADLPDTLNTLDESISQELRNAFAMHPWVREVVEVRVTRPSRICVQLTYREPIAAVHTTRSLETVDRDGVLLPITRPPDPPAYPTIIGIHSTPSGPAGTRWDDPSLTAGISVAETLAPHSHALGVATVDVGSFRPANTNPGSIYLLTERGTRIKWGRPPSANYPGEVPVQDKIDRLSKYASEHGSLDDPSGPYEMDITHWQEISLRPRNQTPTKNR